MGVAAIAVGACVWPPHDLDAPWAAEVTRADETEVCTEALEENRAYEFQRGDVACFSVANTLTAWDTLDLDVGDCVNARVLRDATAQASGPMSNYGDENKAPAKWVIDSEIDCPD